MAKLLNVGCGLVNKKQNCFMNATLQALFHIPKISNCLHTDLENINKCKIKSCISCMILNLYKDVKYGQAPCSPYHLYGALKQTNLRFSKLLNGDHQDAHEFLMVLNQELEKQTHSARWITSNFTANLTTHVECISCRNIHQSFSVITDVSVQVIGNSTVQAALNSYFDRDDIDYLCETTRTYNTVKKKNFILSGPECLCVQLGRFSDQGKKITDRIEISPEVCIRKHFLKTQVAQWKYKLVAIVNHFGESRNVGHYNTIILAPNGECYEFDDRSVRTVSAGLISGKDAYMLFYQLIEVTKFKKKSGEIRFGVCFQFGFNNDVFNTKEPHVAITIDETSPINNEEQNSVNEDRGTSSETDMPDRIEENSIQNETNEADVESTETHCLGIPSNNETDQQKITGRRIVDMDYFFNQMKQLTRYECTNCEYGILTYSKEIRRGLQSSFIFVCGDCGETVRLNSSPTYDDTENINVSAILGITAIGLGHYHLQEFLAHLDVPSMSYVTYHKYEEDKIQREYFNLSKQLEAEALNEEIKLAIQLKDVDSAGNALIPVEFDGSWEKRAYTGNFSSLAGCAAIIGLRTKKILYSAVKKKYCHICKLAESRSATPRKHDCKKNFDGPSSGMETQIIVEGFKYCATKGARFNRYVGDGDSSTEKALRDLQLYKDPYISIEKFECVNHLFRNFFKQFKALLKSSKVNLKGRKLLSLEIGRNICKGIRMAAKHWKESNIEMALKYSNLEKDVMNSFLHYMGIHDKCAEYYCSKTTDEGALDVITMLKKTGVYYEVMDLIQKYFGNNVKSLVAGLCTNRTEGFNSLIAKSLGGKRVCNSLAGSYELRTNIAGVQYNTSGHSGSRVQEHIFGKSTVLSKNLEKNRKRKCLENSITKQNRPKKYSNDEPSTKKKQKKYYGDSHEELDMTESQFELAKTRHFKRLSENQRDRDIILIETQAQHHSFKWSEIRRIMLTSSYFGRVLNVRGRSSYTKIVEEILYNNVQYGNTAEMRHQRLHENFALTIFTGLYPFEPVTRCGIFIDEEIPYLGASPFRLYGSNGIIVVKCPKKEFGKCLNVAMKTISFWAGTPTDRRINYKCHWYYEIQGQLHITKRRVAYLVIYLGDDAFEIIEIERNDEFWKEKMEKELFYFYNEALLKEIINPREERGMEMRKYNSKKETFE